MINMTININNFNRKVNIELFYLNISVKLIQEGPECNVMIFKKNPETEKNFHCLLLKNLSKNCFKNVTRKQVVIWN